MVHDTQSAQQAQSKERNRYIVKSWRQSNAPNVLIIVFTLLAYCLLSTLLALALTMPVLRHWPSIAATCRHKAIVVMRRMDAMDCFHDFTMYFAPCFVLVEHSVYHESISVLINVYIIICNNYCRINKLNPDHCY